MTQLLFNKDSDFLAADSFQLKQDGTIEVRNGNWIGGLWPGFTRTDEDDNEYDSWAKFCELRDNGTITVQPVPQSELDAIAAEQAKQAERASKLNAYTFKGVPCSVNEADQNGWETVNARVKRLVAVGEPWRDFPFFMDNGNHVLIESEQEWDDFISGGWAAREAIMLARLQP